MDRMLAVCLVLSGGAHLMLIGYAPSFLAGSPGVMPVGEMEVIYLDARGNGLSQLRQTISGERGSPRTTELDMSHRTAEGVTERHAVPRPVRGGSGETLNDILKEGLKPLDPLNSQSLAEAVDRYRRRIEEVLDREAAVVYPRAALARGREARVHVRFCIRSDGTLDSFDIPGIDGGFGKELASALRQAAGHFPVFPDDVPCARLTFSWPVRFNLSTQ
ncbi:MAG: energy transducer TonB [Candidatus Aureabacteria bacterium]|nr:energy transducer TonB [Candidatus Auribacterota bacterium]